MCPNINCKRINSFKRQNCKKCGTAKPTTKTNETNIVYNNQSVQNKPVIDKSNKHHQTHAIQTIEAPALIYSSNVAEHHKHHHKKKKEESQVVYDSSNPKTVSQQKTQTVLRTNITNQSNIHIKTSAPAKPKTKIIDTKPRGYLGGPIGLYKVGDWKCPSCNNVNFRFRTLCNRCKLPKPPESKKPASLAVTNTVLPKENPSALIPVKAESKSVSKSKSRSRSRSRSSSQSGSSQSSGSQSGSSQSGSSRSSKTETNKNRKDSRHKSRSSSNRHHRRHSRRHKDKKYKKQSKQMGRYFSKVNNNVFNDYRNQDERGNYFFNEKEDNVVIQSENQKNQQIENKNEDLNKIKSDTSSDIVRSRSGSGYSSVSNSKVKK